MKSLLAILLFVFAGCVKSDPPPLQFAVGGAVGEFDFWQEQAKEFEAKTGTPIEILRQPSDTDQRRQGLVLPLKAKRKGPDIFLMDVAWIAQLAASNWLEPLDPYIDNEPFDLSKWFQSILNQVDRYQGKLIAFPVYLDAGLLYYRKDLLEEYGYSDPPETWQELIDISLDIQNKMKETRPDYYPFVWQGAQYEGLICNFLEFAASNGGGIHIENGKIKLSTPENLKALETMRDLIHLHRISSPNTFTEMKEEETRAFFEQGGALFERNWPYSWTIHQSHLSPVKGKIAVAPLPHFPGHPSASALGGWHIAISKFSDRKSEAWEFLKFVTSQQTQKKMAMELAWPPAREDLYEDRDLLNKFPHFGGLKTIFQTTVSRPNLPYYTQLSEILQRNLNAVLANELSPKEGLTHAENEGQILANRYRS